MPEKNTTTSWKSNLCFVLIAATTITFVIKRAIEDYYYLLSQKDKKSPTSESAIQTNEHHTQESATQTDNLSQVVVMQKPIPRAQTFSHLDTLDNIIPHRAQVKKTPVHSPKSPQSENATTVSTQESLPLAGKAAHTLVTHDSCSVLPSRIGSAEKLHDMDQQLATPRHSTETMEKEIARRQDELLSKVEADRAIWPKAVVDTSESKSSHKKPLSEDEKKNFNFFPAPSAQSAAPQPLAKGWFSWLG